MSGSDCQQPCFCDWCWPTTIHDLIGERAVLYRAALADGLYTSGLEHDLADQVIMAIPAALRLDVLAFMLTWDHLQPRVTAVDCLLDETDIRSYQAAEEMGAVLLAAIRAQGREGHALHELIVNEVSNQLVADVYSFMSRPVPL